MMKINWTLLPIKVHYFFFMAGMGPVLPFLPVIGKQLGISTVTMGVINGILPFFYLVVKPLFGYIADRFSDFRKQIFISLIALTSFFFTLMVFIPRQGPVLDASYNCSEMPQCLNWTTFAYRNCSWSENGTERKTLVDTQLSCYQNTNCVGHCTITTESSEMSGLCFWSFIILITLGTVGYNITNSVTDAICFDLLGDGQQIKYGEQRVWGSVGFGVTALLGGLLIDTIPAFSISKDFTPAFMLGLMCILFDVFSCTKKLNLPPFPKSENIFKDISKLLKQPHIATFLCFTVVAGICESAVIYYLLWFMEDLAQQNGSMGYIKLLEGLTIAAETLVGEVVSFQYAGRIIARLGYGHCLSLCFVFYAVRLGLIACLANPWWVLPIEIIMQGPTYALCYSTIVAYASEISPKGASATMQGIVAGMDDGLGFFLGCIFGGLIYKAYGGNVMFFLYSILAAIAGIAHHCLYVRQYREAAGKVFRVQEAELANLRRGVSSGGSLEDDVFV